MNFFDTESILFFGGRGGGRGGSIFLLIDKKS